MISVEESSYDHLALSNTTKSGANNDQDTEYSYATAKPLQNHKEKSQHTEHSYFVLGPSGTNEREEKESVVCDNTSHPYFVLEAETETSSYATSEPLQDDIENSENADHSYFVLESSGANERKEKENSACDNTSHPYFVLKPNAEASSDGREIALRDSGEHSYSVLEKKGSYAK